MHAFPFRLVKSADAIVHGVVVRTGTRVAIVDGVLEPRTHTWIQITEWVSGDAPSRVVEIVEFGGKYGDTVALIAGTPQYRVGEDVVVFLTAEKGRPGRFRTHQMAQGKYHVLPPKGTTPRMVARELDEISFATWTGAQFQLRPAAAAAMTLPQLLTSIDRVLGNLEGRAGRKRGVK